MGLDGALDGLTSIGAPIAIWRALAPTMRARSKRVSLGGPIKSFSSVPVFLELSYAVCSYIAFLKCQG
jgi:pyruvate dehydrogenase complex dehydrogenase (E1) component